MMNIGDFGHARFSQNKKGFETTIDCYGKIEDYDVANVFFMDNDGFPYLAERIKFSFQKCEFKDKNSDRKTL